MKAAEEEEAKLKSAEAHLKSLEFELGKKVKNLYGSCRGYQPIPAPPQNNNCPICQLAGFDERKRYGKSMRICLPPRSFLIWSREMAKSKMSTSEFRYFWKVAEDLQIGPPRIPSIFDLSISQQHCFLKQIPKNLRPTPFISNLCLPSSPHHFLFTFFS